MEATALPGFKQDRKIANRFFYAPEDPDANITICQLALTGRRIAIKPDKNCKMAVIVYGKIRKSVKVLELTEDLRAYQGIDEIVLSYTDLEADFARPTDKCTNCGKPARITLWSYPGGSTSLGVGHFCNDCLQREGLPFPSSSFRICHICRRRGEKVKVIGTTPYYGQQSSATCREFRVHEKCVKTLGAFRKRIRICF